MSGAPTVESLWRDRAGAPLTDSLLDWPPDVFALTEVILEHSEAYRFAVSPPVGRTWPPEATDWASDIARAAAAWTAWARSGAGPLPDLVVDAWTVVRSAASTELETIAQGLDWPLCEALLTLHAIGDEACAGMGVSVEGREASGAATRARGRELLARTGSLARIGRHALRVLPKVRTPAGGISMRSLARYACVRGPGVDAAWRTAPAQRPGHDPRRRPVNILLLPWPLRIRESDFRAEPASIRRAEREPFGFFQFDPAEPFDLSLVDRLLAAACDEVHAVDIVVLPESSVPLDQLSELEAVLGRHGVDTLVAGVREPVTDGGEPPGNWVHLGVRVGGRWWHYRQNKHHRWSLDEGQVLQYHLGGALHPRLRWWETMGVPRRSIQFVELGGAVTIVAVVCEDLARLDAVADLLRTVGPTLVLTVLLDGPQLASRWTARYASVLADDPGSAVLTLTSFGMVQRSRPAGAQPSRIVALWKAPTHGIREIALEAGSEGVLLSTTVDRATRYSADGRWPADDATLLRDVGVHQVRAAAAGSSAQGSPVDPSTDAPVGLDEGDLSVLAAWAEAIADTGSGEALDEVLADAAPTAAWRAGLGLDPPSGPLAAALEALAHKARRVGDAGQLLDAVLQSLDRGDR